MLILILGLVIFLGIHSVQIIAPEWREARIAAMGKDPWRGVYSLVSAAGLVLIIYGFSLAWPEAPILYEPPVWMKHLAVLLMLFAFIAMAVFTLPAGKLKPILKHPMLLSVKIWAFAHLLANGDLASLLLFGSFLIWAVIDRISVKRRPVVAGAAAGSGSIVYDIAAIIIGFAVYVLFIWKLHLWLFGAMPIAVA